MSRQPHGALALLMLTLLTPLSAAAACLPAPAPVKDLDIPRFYGDAKGSVIDPKQKALHDAAVEPLTAFVREVTGDADKSFKRSKPADQREAASCALDWIMAWAQADAFLGRMAQAQAEYQRKWDLAGVALAYLKLRPYATPEQKRIIEPWLIRFADATRGFFDNPTHRRNNHWYWLGLAMAATALATDSDRHWLIARGIMADAARDIAADGTLRMELERGRRALLYHTFAAMPLVIMAELARAKGEDWYHMRDGALHRLVGATLSGLADPALFATLAGEAQDTAPWSGAVWVHLYAARFPERAAGAPLSQIKTSYRWVGGDVTVLEGVVARISARQPKG